MFHSGAFAFDDLLYQGPRFTHSNCARGALSPEKSTEDFNQFGCARERVVLYARVGYVNFIHIIVSLVRSAENLTSTRLRP